MVKVVTFGTVAEVPILMIERLCTLVCIPTEKAIASTLLTTISIRLGRLQ